MSSNHGHSLRRARGDGIGAEPPVAAANHAAVLGAAPDAVEPRPLDDRTFKQRTHDIATLIEGAAEEVDADLIVIGTHGRGGVTAAVMGSSARALCHRAHRPVLVVPPAGRAESEHAG